MDYAFEAEELETTEVTSCYLEGTLALETKVSSFTQQHRVSTRNLEKNTGGSIVFDNDLEGHVNRITFKQSCMLYRFWEMIFSFSERLEKSTCTEEVVDLFRKYVKVPGTGAYFYFRNSIRHQKKEPAGKSIFAAKI